MLGATWVGYSSPMIVNSLLSVVLGGWMVKIRQIGKSHFLGF